MKSFVEELHVENSHVIDDANAMDRERRYMKQQLSFSELQRTRQASALRHMKAVMTAFRKDLGLVIEDVKNGVSQRLMINAIVQLYEKLNVTLLSDHDDRTTTNHDDDDDRSANGNRIVHDRLEGEIAASVESASSSRVIAELTRQHNSAENHQRILRKRVDRMSQDRQKLWRELSADNTNILADLNSMKRENQQLKWRIAQLESVKARRDHPKKLKKNVSLSSDGSRTPAIVTVESHPPAATSPSVDDGFSSTTPYVRMKTERQMQIETVITAQAQTKEVYVPLLCGMQLLQPKPAKAKTAKIVVPVPRPQSSKPKIEVKIPDCLDPTKAVPNEYRSTKMTNVRPTVGKIRPKSAAVTKSSSRASP